MTAVPELPPVDVDPVGDDLTQEDTHPTHYPALAVSVEGIARVRNLPARRAILGNIVVPLGGRPVRIVGRSDQRQSILVAPNGAAVYLFTVEPAAASTAGFVVADGRSFGIDYSGDLYAVNNGAADAVVSLAHILVEE